MRFCCQDRFPRPGLEIVRLFLKGVLGFEDVGALQRPVESVGSGLWPFGISALGHRQQKVRKSSEICVRAYRFESWRILPLD
jgi:hypothetical protein